MDADTKAVLKKAQGLTLPVDNQSSYEPKRLDSAGQKCEKTNTSRLDREDESLTICRPGSNDYKKEVDVTRHDTHVTLTNHEHATSEVSDDITTCQTDQDGRLQTSEEATKKKEEEDNKDEFLDYMWMAQEEDFDQQVNHTLYTCCWSVFKQVFYHSIYKDRFNWCGI